MKHWYLCYEPPCFISLFLYFEFVIQNKIFILISWLISHCSVKLIRLFIQWHGTIPHGLFLYLVYILVTLWVLIWTSISRDLLDLKSLALSYCLLALAIHLLSALHHWTLSLWLAQVLSLVGLGWCINAQLKPLGIKTQSCTLSQWSFWL